MEAEKISVIIPVYNGAEWLETCVESVLNQTWENLEVLIVDDHSTDDSMEIAQRLQQKDDRIKKLYNPDEGVSTTRNLGIERSGGEWITFVDADDKIEPHMLTVLAGILRENKSDLAVCGFQSWDGTETENVRQKNKNAENIDNSINAKKISEEKDTRNKNSENSGENKEITEFLKNSSDSDNIKNYLNNIKTVSKEEYLSDYLLRGTTRCWSVLYRRDVIGTVRFRKELTIGEDMMFLMDLLPRLSSVSITDYPGYFYRINDKGAMKSPFTPAYMNEIDSWRLARDVVAQDYPAQLARVNSILAVSAMLIAGKLSRLSRKERSGYQEYVRECQKTVKEALAFPGAAKQLPGGYQVKTLLFRTCPAVYLGLYHLWKSR